MKRKISTLATVILSIGLLFTSCGQMPTSKTYTAMPSGEEMQKAYDDLLKKADLTDPEFYEFSCSFKPSMTGKAEKNYASMAMTVVSPTDKNKLIEYIYMFHEGKITGPREITLSQGIGSDEVFIEKYEEFAGNLFKRDYFPAFSKVDEMCKVATEKANYGKACYVGRYNVEIKRDPKNDISITVNSTKSITASKTSFFDKDGNILEK